jgi:hypothetical protein
VRYAIPGISGFELALRVVKRLQQDHGALVHDVVHDDEGMTFVLSVPPGNATFVLRSDRRILFATNVRLQTERRRELGRDLRLWTDRVRDHVARQRIQVAHNIDSVKRLADVVSHSRVVAAHP